jgi:hypothetical protein
MSFKVQSENLRSQSEVWRERKEAARQVRADIAPALGRGDAFGILAGGAGVSQMYDEWVSDMDNALHDAMISFRYLQRALVSTANGYDESDATAVTAMNQLDKLIDPEDYRHD